MITLPKGTKDVTPSEAYKWHYVEGVVRGVAAEYCVGEIRTPVFEHTELFARGVGDTTDIVNKEMYTFDDKGGRSMTLKPEGTAGVARAFIEHSLYADAQPTKMYYITPVFRYERPQSGRLREHHQFGVEFFGSASPAADVEVISLLYTVYKRLGIKALKLHLNSIGCRECRKDYNAALKEYFGAHIDKMCPTCRERLAKNPLRILDCKEEGCRAIVKDAPVVLDYLCDDCRAHHEAVCKGLDLPGGRIRHGLGEDTFDDGGAGAAVRRRAASYGLHRADRRRRARRGDQDGVRTSRCGGRVRHRHRRARIQGADEVCGQDAREIFDRRRRRRTRERRFQDKKHGQRRRDVGREGGPCGVLLGKYGEVI